MATGLVQPFNSIQLKYSFKSLRAHTRAIFVWLYSIIIRKKKIKKFKLVLMPMLAEFSFASSLVKILSRGSWVGQKKSVHLIGNIIGNREFEFPMMPQPSVAREEWHPLSNPINFSDTSHSRVSVSSCMRIVLSSKCITPRRWCCISLQSCRWLVSQRKCVIAFILAWLGNFLKHWKSYWIAMNMQYKCPPPI